MARSELRRAERHIRRVADTVTLLTQARLADLDRKSRFEDIPDGFPGATLSDGGSRSTEGTSSTERAALRRDERHHSDPVGRSIAEVFVLLKRMADDSARVHHLVSYIDHVKSAAEGRVSSLSGECLACSDVVSGAEHDRLRAGLCRACFDKCRAEHPADRGAWIARQRGLSTFSPDDMV